MTIVAPGNADAASLLAEECVPLATELACLVHDQEVGAIAEFVAQLDAAHTRGLLVVLAAMVPLDQPVGDLLAWTATEPPARHLRPCGTLAAYRRHLRHGERPCERCKAANAARWHVRTARLRREAAVTLNDLGDADTPFSAPLEWHQEMAGDPPAPVLTVIPGDLAATSVSSDKETADAA